MREAGGGGGEGGLFCIFVYTVCLYCIFAREDKPGRDYSAKVEN